MAGRKRVTPTRQEGPLKKPSLVSGAPKVSSGEPLLASKSGESARENFPPDVKLHVAMEVLLLCSRPDCRRPTYGPTAGGEDLTNVGTAAHIIAASPNGPRARKVSAEFKRSPQNAIWLCRDHGKAIDDDVDAFTIEELQQWKRDAIDYAQRCIAARTLDVDGRMRRVFASRHELAMALAPALSELDVVRRKVAASLRDWQHPRLGDGASARTRLSEQEVKELDRAIHAVKELEHKVAAIFGARVASVITELEGQTRKLARYVDAQLADEASALIGSAASENEPLYGGAGHERWMSALTDLIHEWSASFLGRHDARPMPDIELGERATKLREQASIDGHDEWVAIHDEWDPAGDEAAYEEYQQENAAKEEFLRSPIELGSAGTGRIKK